MCGAQASDDTKALEAGGAGDLQVLPPSQSAVNPNPQVFDVIDLGDGTVTHLQVQALHSPPGSHIQGLALGSIEDQAPLGTPVLDVSQGSLDPSRRAHRCRNNVPNKDIIHKCRHVAPLRQPLHQVVNENSKQQWREW